MDTNLHKLSLLTLPECSCWTESYDWMHCKYLGFHQYSHGSTFAVLVNMVMPSSPEENLKNAWTFLKSYFKNNKTPTPFRYINKLSMFVRMNRFPKLRGKASEVRHLGPALRALWHAYMKPAIALHRKILTMLKCNVGLEQMLTEFKEDFAFPAGPVKLLKKHVTICCCCCTHKWLSTFWKKGSSIMTSPARVTFVSILQC